MLQTQACNLFGREGVEANLHVINTQILGLQMIDESVVTTGLHLVGLNKYTYTINKIVDANFEPLREEPNPLPGNTMAVPDATLKLSAHKI